MHDSDDSALQSEIPSPSNVNIVAGVIPCGVSVHLRRGPWRLMDFGMNGELVFNSP